MSYRNQILIHLPREYKPLVQMKSNAPHHMRAVYEKKIKAITGGAKMARFIVSIILGWSLSTIPVEAAEFKGITLGLVSTSWDTQLAPVVAQQAGFFKQENLDVRNVTVTQGGAVMIALLTSGQAQMAITGAVSALQAISRGAPITIVSGVFDKAEYILMGAKGIHDLNGLRGKLIGSTGAGSFSEFAVVESLRRKGNLIRDKDYTLVPAGATAVRVAALQSGRIQAAPVSSLARINLEREGFPVLIEIGKAIPEFPFLVVIAKKEFVRDDSQKVFAFLRALDRSVHLIRNDKDKAVALARAYGLRGEPETQKKYLDYIADSFQLKLSKDNVNALLKVLEIDQPPEAFFSDAYLKEALGN
jgi:ABC-type nitrate/sulfonate/bicarbonate transport system substrate-binding protein